MGSVAKSYMRKGFLICEEMRKYLTIYDISLIYGPIFRRPWKNVKEKIIINV
jgi:hypothetical protein